MTLFEQVKKIAKEHGMSIAEVERKSGLSENYLYTWKKTDNPRKATVEAVAHTLGVTVDELLGTKPVKEHYYDLTDSDKRDIGKEVDRMLAGLSSDAEVNYYGEPMTDDDKKKMRVAMIAALQAAQIEARKKFTPKKYRDNE